MSTEEMERIRKAYDDPPDVEVSRDHFRQEFRAIQTASGLDDVEMARLCAISRPTVGRWARGEAALFWMLRPTLLKGLRDYFELQAYPSLTIKPLGPGKCGNHWCSNLENRNTPTSKCLDCFELTYEEHNQRELGSYHF